MKRILYDLKPAKRGQQAKFSNNPQIIRSN